MGDTMPAPSSEEPISEAHAIPTDPCDLTQFSLAELLSYGLTPAVAEDPDTSLAVIRAVRDGLDLLATLATVAVDVPAAELVPALEEFVRRLDVGLELARRAAVATGGV